jgi:hypothetical protein
MHTCSSANRILGSSAASHFFGSFRLLDDGGQKDDDGNLDIQEEELLI